MKKCSKCRVDQELINFNKNKSTKDGLEYRCNSCRKIYYQTNKEYIIKKSCKNQKDNPERVKLKNKLWQEKNKDRAAENHKNWLKNNPEKRKASIRKWNKKNPNYQNNKKKTDINFKLKCTIRTRLYYALKNNEKKGSAVRDLGCTIDQLKLHLESKFQNGMNWSNHSKYGWHIDHIIPLSKFNLSDRKQLLKAVHYTNLQPMWAKENLSKGNKINE